VAGADREGPIQRSILAYLRLRLPGCVVAAVPNSTDIGGKRAMLAVANQKRNGLLPGFPDVVCYWCGECLLVEVKAPGGSLSKAQKDCHERLRAAGFQVVVARSIDDISPAVDALREKHMVRGK
jgi:hypothetical protein